MSYSLPLNIAIYGTGLYADTLEKVWRTAGIKTVTVATNHVPSVSDLHTAFNSVKDEPTAIHLIVGDYNAETIGLLIQHISQQPHPHQFIVVHSSVDLGLLEQIELNEPLGEHTHLIGMPLFIREGSALNDLMHPWLLLLSGHQAPCQIYISWLELIGIAPQKTMIVNHKTADLIRIASNAILATRLSLMNELANIAEQHAIDMGDVQQGLSADPRIGDAFMSPGVGFGGKKFHQELQRYTLLSQPKQNYPSLINTVLSINQSQQEVLFRKVWRFFSGNLQNKKVAILGAAYKAKTESIAFSAVHPTLKAFWSQQVQVYLYDPMATQKIIESYPDQIQTERLVTYDSLEHAVTDVDAICILTDWPQFKSLNALWFSKHAPNTPIFDGRNLYSPQAMSDHGIAYFAIGRGLTI